MRLLWCALARTNRLERPLVIGRRGRSRSIERADVRIPRNSRSRATGAANRASSASNPARIPGSRHSSPAKSPARKADFDENPASLAGFSLLTAGRELAKRRKALSHGGPDRPHRRRARLVQIHVRVGARGAFGPRDSWNRRAARPAVSQGQRTSSSEPDLSPVEGVRGGMRRLISGIKR
jgi:hypothetical protein